MMNELKYVYEVYQERSFSKAAKKLYITQPALSAMVKKAEMEIGQPIFDRSTIPLTLTDAGRYYIASAKNILFIQKNMTSYFQDLQHLQTGHLSIGGSSFFCTYVLSKQVGRFQKRYPGITIDMVESNVQELKKRVADDTLNLIMETAFFDNDHLKKYFCYYEDILLGVPASFEINRGLEKYALSFRDVCEKKHEDPTFPAAPLQFFKDLPFLMLKEGNDLYYRGISICQNAGFHPRIVIKLDQILTAFYIACTGAGAVFLRASMHPYLPMTNQLVYYKLSDPLARREVYLAHKQGCYVTNAMAAFLKMSGVKDTQGFQKKKI